MAGQVLDDGEIFLGDRRKRPVLAQRCLAHLDAGQKIAIARGVIAVERIDDRDVDRLELVRRRLVDGRGPDTEQGADLEDRNVIRSEEHTSELQSLMRISYAVFCLKKKKVNQHRYCQQTRIHRTNLNK